MDYQISKGDCLWNIVKTNYKCNSNKEIQDTINMIVKENGIKDANKIYTGTSIVLPETDTFISQKSSKVDEFEAWTSPDENTDITEVEDFEMFENTDILKYSQNVLAFSQDVVSKYDTDGNGLDFDEFIAMSTNGEGIPEEYKEQMTAVMQQLFDDFSMDDDAEHISASEFASQLIMGDIDWDNYDKYDGDLEQLLDGKLNFIGYNSHSADPTASDYQSSLEIRKALFDYFYA